MSELPMAIAPDGEVVQIALTKGTPCALCALKHMCEEMTLDKLTRTMGEDCRHYDDDGEIESAYWRKV